MQASRVRAEDNEQRELLILCQMHEGRWPELAMIFHVPNGGKRGKVEGAILRGLGVRPGVPDLVLPAARRGWFGLYIEMKRPDATGASLTPVQREWRSKLLLQGYLSVVCDGAPAAWSVISWYMQGVYTSPVPTPELLPVDMIRTIV